MVDHTSGALVGRKGHRNDLKCEIKGPNKHNTER